MNTTEQFVAGAFVLLGVPIDGNLVRDVTVDVDCAMMQLDRSSKPPTAGESLAYTFSHPKTAALAFDRVHRWPISGVDTPDEVSYFLSSNAENNFLGLLGVMRALDNRSVRMFSVPHAPSHEDNKSPLERRRSVEHLLSSRIHEGSGLMPTIVLSSEQQLDRDFPTGRDRVLLTTIRDIGLVDEETLEWSQVLEFRRDRVARARYRRFVRWVDGEIQTGSPDAVVDRLAEYMADYNVALSKHGIKVATGTLSALVDPTFVGAVAAGGTAVGAAAGGLAGLLAGSTLAMGRVVVEFGTRMVESLDVLREQKRELAYVHDLRRTFATQGGTD